MDNGPAFLATLCSLEKHYYIKHIKISRYNSCANGLVEHSHFEVREAIFKACNGDESKWFRYVYFIFWAEQVMVRKCMGCSPYSGAQGTDPLLPLDIVESNYLLLLFLHPQN
jgi:hypothetical protein